MLQNISSHLLTEWMAYYSLEPFGAELLDLHLAKFQAMMASTKDDMKDPQKFRIWKRILQETGKFDPQKYFNELKAALFQK